MTPLRDAIIAALEAEIGRIESKTGAWRGDDAERVETCREYVDRLKADGRCRMEIRPEIDPRRIRL